MQTRFSLFFTTLGCIILFFTSKNISAQKTLWQIGNADKSDAEFALAPSGYSQFLEKDFGWEDGYFLIGKSDPKTDWPYALPGPQDSWGGTAPNAGLHAPELNILFGIDKMPGHGQYVLTIDLLDMSAEKP
ncbi:MAG TPA: polysaccharide lyase family protein, partial [Hanamia sp.]|nr:polysaccharide lyase family protein [Hanamia sp.]